jgi:hypothetical protein
MDSGTSYATTTKRSSVALAVCAAIVAVVGGTSTIGDWYVAGNMRPPNAGLWVASALGVYALWFVNVFVFFVIFGGIPWLFLDRLRLRSWWVASSAGFVVLFSLMLWMSWHSGADYSSYGSHVTILHGQLTEVGRADAWRNSIIAGLLGGAFGWLLWRIAYRRVQAFNPVDEGRKADVPNVS